MVLWHVFCLSVQVWSVACMGVGYHIQCFSFSCSEGLKFFFSLVFDQIRNKVLNQFMQVSYCSVWILSLLRIISLQIFIMFYGVEIYIYSALNNSNETYIFFCMTERVILGSAKTALKFRYEIWIG